MHQLLADPETLPFYAHQQVQLGTLKREIDRRLNKIKNMLGAKPHPAQPLVQHHTATQTLPIATSPTKPLVHPPNPLQPSEVHATTNNLVLRDEQKRYKSRGSLPWGGKRVPLERQPNQRRRPTHKDTYLTSRKPTHPLFQYDNSVESVEKEKFQQNQDDRIFNQFELSAEGCLELNKNEPSPVNEIDPNTFLIRLQSRPSESRSEWQSRMEGASIDTYGRRCSSIIMKRASVKKVRFTERTAVPECEQRRLNVSEQCRDGMAALVEQFLGKKRREPTDNKVRSNIIRKVDERYGNYYQN